MKPCAERQMRGLRSHWQPDTGASSEHELLPGSAFTPTCWGQAPGRGHLGRGTSCAPSLCWD